MNIAIFEEAAVEKLAPITTSKPAYAIQCGGFRLVDLVDLLETKVIAVVRPHLQQIQDRDFAFAAHLDTTQPKTLVLNSQIAPTVPNYQKIKELALADDCVVFGHDGHNDQADGGNEMNGNTKIIAAVLPTELLAGEAWSKNLPSIIDAANLTSAGTTLDTFEYPHDVVRFHMQHCEQNLEFRLLQNHFGRLADGVFVSKKSPPAIDPSAVFDSSSGPIIFDANVKVGPHCFFRGPVYIGENCKISEHSSIKDSVSIAHTCKIGGEVEGCVMEPWTNKQHHGFLGHSYLGSWINLGAGTCNSDLKNTYGKINMIYGDQTVATDMQFVGCIMGDYAKTSINTSIFTGKTIGVASMVYGLATANVPSFVNYARTLGQLGLLPPEIAIATQKRMFARRNVDHQTIDSQLIHDMFMLTDSERPSGLSPQPIAF